LAKTRGIATPFPNKPPLPSRETGPPGGDMAMGELMLASFPKAQKPGIPAGLRIFHLLESFQEKRRKVFMLTGFALAN
jgi:hypothetical protein